MPGSPSVVEREAVVPKRRSLSVWRKRPTLALLMPAWWRGLLILDVTLRMFGGWRRIRLSLISKPLWKIVGGGVTAS